MFFDVVTDGVEGDGLSLGISNLPLDIVLQKDLY